jgi:hypothetical protein
MVEAVLAGERHPKQLARRRDPRMVASEETVAAALLGDYRPEHLLVRRQSLQAYRQYPAWMADGERETERLLAKLESRLAPGPKLLSPPQDRHKSRRNEPRFDLRAYRYRIFGADLTAVPGVNSLTAHTLWSEVGPDLPKFPHAAALASGRGRCPDNRISGGQILSGRTRQVVHRLAVALRRAAPSLHRRPSYLGHYFRRRRTRLGTPAAITAAAHQLARVLYPIVTTRQPYDQSVFAVREARAHHRQFIRLKKQAAAFGFQLLPLARVP